MRLELMRREGILLLLCESNGKSKKIFKLKIINQKMKKNMQKIIYLWMVLWICHPVYGQRIAAGGWHSLVVCEDSTVKAFGENATGQLGNNSTDDSNVPVTAIGLNGIISVSAGGDQLEAHSMALKADGTVWCWGSNLYGGLGNGLTGTNNSTKIPVQTLLLTNIKAISAGGWHSVALKQDGSVWCWGWNSDGQLGDGSNTDKSIANQVPNLNNIKQIAAGTYHTLALKQDGTVWAWGDNLYGQLGDGTTIDRNSPVQVQGLTDVIHIAAGRFYSLAIKSDGTVWCWGQNLYGQLGDGSTTDRSTPVQVQNFLGATAMASCGAFHTVVVKNDGSVWAWGRNTYGNLGNNTVNNSSLPVQMMGINDVAGVAAGTNFTILYKTDGSFWGCGRNASGQLGDGTFTQRNELTEATPVCKILQHTSSLSKILTNFSISVYPNPSPEGVFYIDLANLDLYHSKIAIYNALGQIVYSKEIGVVNNKLKIDLTAEPSGFYYLHLKGKQGNFCQKLIKP